MFDCLFLKRNIAMARLLVGRVQWELGAPPIAQEPEWCADPIIKEPESDISQAREDSPSDPANEAILAVIP